MAFSWPKTLKCTTLLVVVVHMLVATYPSCASQSRGYYNNGYDDSDGYKPSYSYNTPYYPTPTPPSYKDGQSEQRYYSNSSPDKDSFLQVHNSARAAVGLSPLSWDDRLASFAQSWANRRVNDCRLVHSDGPYGENIFWGSGGYSAAFAVQSWVNERKYYDYYSNSCRGGMDCGHYTQIIWKSSTRLGCARVTCNNGGVFVTCNYDPPGNYIGMRPY